MSILATFFLATFAMLYVVGETLPKTDFLTKIDRVIVATIISMLLVGVSTMILFELHRVYGEQTANAWNLWIAVGGCVVYVIVNLILFLPALLGRRAILKRLRSFKQQTDKPSGFHNPINTLEQTLDDAENTLLSLVGYHGIELVAATAQFIPVEDLYRPPKVAARISNHGGLQIKEDQYNIVSGAPASCETE
eukprot:COSAG01_NODE_8141_length_2906_cov_4.727823_3_plen_193_part_00